MAFASKAFPCTEVLRIFREEGLVGRRRLGRGAAPRPHGGLRAEARSSSTATPSPRPSCATIAELGVMCVIDNLDEIEPPRPARGRDAAAGDAAGRARGRDGHPPRRRDGPRRPEVRAHARRGPRRRSPGSARRRLGRPAGDPHAHRLPAVRPRALPRGDRGDRRARAVRALRPRRRARRPVHAPSSATPSIDEWVGGGGRRGARAARRAREGARDRARPRARRQRRRDALHRRVGQAPRRRRGWRSTAACPTTCARCSTARPTRPTSPTGSARPPIPASAATSRASTASRAT